MSQKLTKKDIPRFAKINKYNVAIRSLRNKLKHANGIDELTQIASKIVDLENLIMTEKSSGYKQLESEQKKIEKRINRLQKLIKLAELDLNRIETTLDFKLNGYRKTLSERIQSLSAEYTSMVKYLDPNKK